MFVWIGLIFVLDQVLAKRLSGRYFFLHAVVNLCINLPISARDTVHFLTHDPIRSGIGFDGFCASKQPSIITNALHLYHLAFFSMKPIDLIHHIPAILVVCGSHWYAYGPVWNAQVFLALMGIPGGVDYALLTLVKSGVMCRGTEKVLNAHLNVWMRCPAALLTSFCMAASVIMHADAYNGGWMHQAYHLLVALHGYWNGIFFMERTVRAHERFVLEAKGGGGRKQQGGRKNGAAKKGD